MDKNLLQLKTKTQCLYLPTAEEIREFQCSLRLNVIKAIKKNASEGYYGVSLDNECFNKAILEELAEKGYEISEGGKFTNVKWGSEWSRRDKE